VLWGQARLKGKARPPLKDRLAPRLEGHPAGGLWLQAVSVGEVELARRLVAELARRAPGLPLLLTSTTAAGLSLARRTLGDRLPVLPCPLDLPWPTGRLLDAARPRALVLVETELWPELLHQAARRSLPVVVVNGRISDRALGRYLAVRRPLGALLEPVTLVLARAAEDASRFAAIGVPADRIRVVGDVKFDLEPSPEPLAFGDAVRRWAGDRPVLVAGSTLEGEEAAVLDAVAAVGGPERVFLLLAPRHPERFPAAAAMLDGRGARWAARSRLELAPESVDVLLLDTIGELGRAYQLGAVAFVGGSLAARGGHNPLEPAVWGVPVLSGPHVANFREAYDQLLEVEGVRLVGNSDELARALRAFVDDPSAAAAAGNRARAVVGSNRGATARTVGELLAVVGGAGRGA
jgi:3-deoxy-D-manno-octulosonic-acid transferase